MSTSDFLHKIQVSATRLVRQLTMLSAFYQRLPEIILREHEAIRANDLGIVQKTAEEKSAIGDAISQGFAEFRRAADSIFQLVAMRLEKVNAELHGCKEIIALMDELISTEPALPIEDAVFRRIRAEIAGSYGDFLGRFEVVQPLLEKNRTVVATMLDHQRHSLRFWAEIVQEESSSYDSMGVRRSKGNASLINIQA